MYINIYSSFQCVGIKHTIVVHTPFVFVMCLGCRGLKVSCVFRMEFQITGEDIEGDAIRDALYSFQTGRVFTLGSKLTVNMNLFWGSPKILTKFLQNDICLHTDILFGI